jgi:hypothetical protein
MQITAIPESSKQPIQFMIAWSQMRGSINSSRFPAIVPVIREELNLMREHFSWPIFIPQEESKQQETTQAALMIARGFVSLAPGFPTQQRYLFLRRQCHRKAREFENTRQTSHSPDSALETRRISNLESIAKLPKPISRSRNGHGRKTKLWDGGS